jgi:Tfp pilus assembly protein PilF
VASGIVTSNPLGADGPARLAEAETILNLALKQKPDDPTLLFVRASVLRLQNHYAESAKIYNTLLEKNSQNHQVLNNLAWTLSEDLNKPDEGLKRIDAAISLVGRNPVMLDTRGVILTRLGRLDEAITDLETAAQAAPSAVAFYHLARAYNKAGKVAQFQKYRDRAREAGLNASQLQPSEQAEMEKLMK